jgi:hypothetical protein
MMVEEFVEERETAARLDWRFYLVRYPWMREGNSGIYYGADQELGYEVTMLLKTVQNSFYRDAYLYAIWCEAGRPEEVTDPWFYGYSTTPRWMKLNRSGTGMRSVPAGIALSAPAAPDTRQALHQVGADTGLVLLDDAYLLAVPQADLDGDLIDAVDRVQLGAGLLRDLIDAGL